MLRQVRFPLAYLLFMIPVWEPLTASLHAPFQVLSARLAVSILQATGVPVNLDGLLIRLPGISLEVAQACSGVNFVVAIVALGLPQGYLMLNSVAKRVLLVALAVPIALLSNGLRIGLIGWLSYNGLSGAEIHGPGHVLQGLSVAVVGFLGLSAVARLLSRISPGRPPPPVSEATPHQSAGDTRLARQAALAASFILVCVATLGAVRRPASVETRLPLSSFKEDLGVWRAGAEVPAPDFFGSEGAERISRLYRRPMGTPVQLFVAYYGYQLQGSEVVDRFMLALHRSASSEQVRLADSFDWKANEAIYRGKGRHEYVVFWYDINGRRVASPYRAKAWTIWDSLWRGRSNGAVVMALADIPPSDGAQVTVDVRALAEAAAGPLTRFLP
jgi:EpsI family protein